MNKKRASDKDILSLKLKIYLSEGFDFVLKNF